MKRGNFWKRLFRSISRVINYAVFSDRVENFKKRSYNPYVFHKIVKGRTVSEKKNKKVIIVGAGIAGLTAAYKLAERSFDVTLIEKEDKVGGLARTFRYGDYVFDIGPHRFFSSNPEVNRFLHKVMDNRFLEILRYSAVHFCNKYHTWPLRLKSVFQMPLGVSIPAFFDLFTKGKYKKYNEPTFKNFILAKYGKTLYERFFKGYTEKFLGISPEKVHYHWAKIGVERATIDKKIKTGSISQLFKLMLMPKPRQLNFLYPPGGCDEFCERLKILIEELGGRIITGVTPDEIEHDNANIQSISAGGEKFEADVVIWTAPITELFDYLKLEQPGLSYLDLLIYNLALEEPPRENYQWCYFGSPDLVFSRATNPAQFTSANVPKNKGGLCVEVTCRKGSSLWENPGKIKDKLIKQLAQTGSISDSSVVKDVYIEKIPNTYPIYDINYLEKLNVVRKNLRKLHNLYLAGRTGLFWYNNMDHSIENAFEVVERVAGHSPDTVHIKLADPFHLGAAVGDPSCATV